MREKTRGCTMRKKLQWKLLLMGVVSLLLAVFTAVFVTVGIYLIYRGNRLMASRPEMNMTIYQENAVPNRNNLFPESNGAGHNNLYAENGMPGYSSPGFYEGMPPFVNLSTGAKLVALLLELVLISGSFLFYYYLLTKKYFLYMREIADGVQEFSDGRLEKEIVLRGEDELAQMAGQLNHMATDLIEMMERDHQAETRKNELVTNVAHDLRTPLTSILGYLGLAGKEDITEEQRKQYVITAYEKAKRLEKLIEDLFEYSKMSLGSVKMNYTELDLVCILNQLLEEFYPSFQQSGLECEFYHADKSAVLMADGNLLARAFANLIGNAIKYGADGKRMELSLKQTEQSVIVKILNYGETIPKEALEHVFERFYRAEGSRSTQTGGSGLGLTITKSIVEMHQGTIGVESTLDGTVFTVELPKKPQEQPKTVSQPAE